MTKLRSWFCLENSIARVVLGEHSRAIPMPLSDRAYCTLEIKSFQADARIIEGVASSPAPDRRGDVLVPEGAEFALPMPLLWQHDTTQPIGEVLEASVTPAGIRIRAQIAQVDEPGPLKTRLDEAWQSVKARLVKGLSVGFKPLEARPVTKSDPYGGLHVSRWCWVETSAVTLPMNVAATITAIKSAAASGGLAHAAPGVLSRRPPMQTTYAERITATEAKRAAVLTSMQDLMSTKGDDETTLTPEQTAAYRASREQLTALDEHLTQLREMESLSSKAATPVPAGPAPIPRVQVKANVPPGTAFVRAFCAMAQAKGDSMRAIDYARRWKESTPEVELMIKAAVAPGDTVTPAWAGVLVQIQNAKDQFLELLRPATILGKIPNLRRVPFNTQVPLQTGGGSYGWVGQGAPKPVTKLALTTAALQFSKAAGIIVMTEELVKLSSPSAELIVRNDMLAGIAQFLDLQFIDPAVALVPNVSPASITNGAGTAASSDNAATDLSTLLNHFSTAGYPLASLTLIMSEKNALAMGMKRDAMGNKLFPSMGVDGGSAEGIKVIASNAAGGNVIGLSGPDILYADDGGVNIDVSREATLQMNDAPAAPDATTVFRSLWQDNLVGLRAERMINWQRARTAAVYYLTDAAYTV
jgi:HK97 family phage major capsid protein/HK97 family phage prohead protease